MAEIDRSRFAKGLRRNWAFVVAAVSTALELALLYYALIATR